MTRFTRLITGWLCVVALAAAPLAAQTYFESDFESDTVGAQPAGPFTFSPGSNTEGNGIVIVDGDSAPPNPLGGQSMYVYDFIGDGSSGESTHIRWDFANGQNVSNLRVDVDFQRMYAVSEDDDDTRVHIGFARAGDRTNNSDFRPFEVRIQNNGKLRINALDGTSTLAEYDTGNANTLSLLMNSHDVLPVNYSDPTLGTGTVAPNSVHVFLNGVLVGTADFYVTPDPANAPQIVFNESNEDLGRIGFYQDSKRQGGIVFDNLKIEALEGGATPPPPGDAEVYVALDFEDDTVGEQPAGPFTFSPGSNTEDNGSVVVDGSSSPPNPLSGQSLYIYDLLGDGSSGESTHMRWDFAGGQNVSNMRFDVDFQRMYAVGDDDDDTRVHIGFARAGDRTNNSDFRPFELRLQNNGKVRVNALDGTTTVGDYDTENPNTLTVFANSHDVLEVPYSDPDLGEGTLAPNTLHVYLNGVMVGAFDFHVTPDPSNAPQIVFNESNEDLGRIGLYQDTRRQGGMVFDNLTITAIAAPAPPPGGTVYYENGFETDTVGEQPVGPFSFSPGSNTEGNGIVVIDDTSTPPNPLPGQSLYVYDFIGDGSSGESTHIRWDFAGGENVSNMRFDIDFQRMYAVGEDDDDTRVHIGFARAGDQTNNSDFRPFELRVQNNGTLRVNSLDGSTTVGDYDTDNPNTLTVFANSHDTLDLPYSDADLGAGTLAPNTFTVYLNGVMLGTFDFHVTPDPNNAPQIIFNESDTDLGRIGLYQDSKRQGGIVFDNIRIAEIPPPVQTTVYYENGFEEDTVGEQPVGPFSFSPGSNTEGNGIVVIDDTSTPPNPLPGQSLYVYDFIGDGSSGESTHIRWDFAGGENVSDMRFDIDFQRMYAVGADDDDTRVHIGFARAGDQTNNSDFRPFEIRVQNNGTVRVNALEGSTTIGEYDTENPNTLTVFANSHDTLEVPYDDPVLGSGTLLPNTFAIYLNGVLAGTFDFHVTPDPNNAPQIVFNESDTDLGRIGLYQDSKRQGGIVFDNIRIASIGTTGGAPLAPSDLMAEATSASSVELTWTDNSIDEVGFIIERRQGDDPFAEIGAVPADVTTYLDETVGADMSYDYRVFATNGQLSPASNTASVTTPRQLLPVITQQPMDTEVVRGRGAMLGVMAEGEGDLTYQWYEGPVGDTASPLADGDAAMVTTPPVTAETSFWVEVSNANGSVQSTAAMVMPYDPVLTIVTNADALEDAVDAGLRAGDELVIPNGSYMDWEIDLYGEGTAEDPVVLRAETPGKVFLMGGSRLELGGRYVHVEGLVFNGEYTGDSDHVIEFSSSGGPAHYSRVTNCAIFDSIPRNGDRTFWVSMRGTHNRLDHNYFSGHNVSGVTAVVWLNGERNYHRIDHNHFANRVDGGENGWETIRIGTSDWSLTDSSTTVEYNLFTDTNGEIEVISNKSGDNVYRGNTFHRVQGMLTLRHGDACLVDGNFFLGDGIPQTGGVRIIGRDHIVTNNYFTGLMGRDGATVTVYAGVPNSPLNEYFSADRATVAFNTFVDNTASSIEIAAGFGTRERTVLPTGITVANNVFLSTEGSAFPVVSGENPDAQTWLGNIRSGRDVGVADLGGFTMADPQLVFDEMSGFMRPVDGSPLIDAAVGDFPFVTLDIDGQVRDGMKDIGADEATETAGRRLIGPLTPAMVGPEWLPASRYYPRPLPPTYFEGAVEQGLGIWTSDWFGSINASLFPWVLHETHGWLYLTGIGGDNVVYWDEGLGWIYTNPDIYPFLYDFANDRWLYYEVGTDDPRSFYDYSAEAWFEI